MAGTQTDIKKALDDSAAQSDTILAENRSKFATAPGGGTGTTGATPAATTGTGGTGGGATPESTMTEGTGATPESTGTSMEATPGSTTTP